MAESTLTAAFNDLQGDIGSFLGWGRGADNGEAAWDTQKQNLIDRCTKGGMRKFYFCDHDWSFLRPVASLAIDAGDTAVDLPDDFGGLEGPITVTSDGNINCTVELTSEGVVRRYYAEQGTTTGPPVLAALRPKTAPTLTKSDRAELFLWPESDGDYTLAFQYYILPDYLSGTKPYAYGGAQHSETLLEACLSVAELVVDDAATVHAAEFRRLLEISKNMDRRSKPQVLGYNGDRSDGRSIDWANRHLWPAPVTFNGVEY